MGLKNSQGWWRNYVRITWLREWTPKFRSLQTEEEYNMVDWRFLWCTFSTIEFQDDRGKDQERRVMEILIRDKETGDDVYLQTGWTMLARSLINSLCSLKELWFLELSLYTNKKGYASVYTKNDETPLEWKLTIEEQQKLINSVVINKQKVNDYSELEDKLETMMGKVKMSYTPVEEAKPEETKDDLPF